MIVTNGSSVANSLLEGYVFLYRAMMLILKYDSGKITPDFIESRDENAHHWNSTHCTLELPFNISYFDKSD